MEKLRAENTKLQEQLEIHEINKDQMHMRVWLINNSEIRAVFIWLSTNNWFCVNHVTRLA